MIKAVFFDVDGTLVDSDRPIVVAVQKAFVEAKLPKPTQGQVLKFVGYSLIDWIDLVLRELDLRGDPRSIAQNALVHLQVYLDKHGNVTPGTKSTLEALKKRGVKLFIISNGPRKSIVLGLKHAGLLKFFQAVMGFEQMAMPKPHPESLVNTMKKLNLKKSECLYVGDTDIDTTYAKRAGVKFALLRHSRNSNIRADFKLKKLTDLIAVVRKC